MVRETLWNSPRIPSRLLHEEFVIDVRTKVDELGAADEPSESDLLALFHRYNESTTEERDAIDAAFVWITGYTFATICAMVVTPGGKDYERTLDKWRKAGT